MNAEFYRPQGFSTLTTTLIVALIAAGVGVYFYMSGISIGPEPSLSPTPQPREENSTQNWSTYKNEQFNFSIQYPPGWRVATSSEEQNEIAPLVTIYKAPTPEGMTPPFDHFANATHVSFYPEGIPTEGVIATRATTSLALNEPVSGAYDVLLDSGKAFASEFRFANPPESWQPWGFIWARVHVPDLVSQCISAEGEPLSEEECDPLASEHQIFWEGTVDESIRAMQARMLSTFQFTADLSTNTPEER